MRGMDTDIILGLPWHKENGAQVANWDSMIYEIEKDGRKCQIFPSSDFKLIKVNEYDSVNLIDERRAKKLLL